MLTNIVTNIVATVTCTILTNTVELPHPGGQEKLITHTITAQIVVSNQFLGMSLVNTNSIFIREDKKRLVTEWKEVPIKADTYTVPMFRGGGPVNPGSPPSP